MKSDAMEITSLGIEGAWLIQSKRFTDTRGQFQEWFKRSEVLTKTGFDFEVEQGNFSVNHKGVIRGIHYSLSSKGQAKWVSCISGEILDVIVDIRPSSSTFKRIEYVTLKHQDGRAILINSGLGHGFISKTDNTVVSYLLSSEYSPGDEYEINPFDKELNINWNLESMNKHKLIISAKDSNAPSLQERFHSKKLPF
jgi:dTDP-4-dehydrorhamnose 3,5-epimerase